VGTVMGELISSVHYPLSPVHDFLGPGAEGQQPGKAPRAAMGRQGQRYRWRIREMEV